MVFSENIRGRALIDCASVFVRYSGVIPFIDCLLLVVIASELDTLPKYSAKPFASHAVTVLPVDDGIGTITSNLILRRLKTVHAKGNKSTPAFMSFLYLKRFKSLPISVHVVLNSVWTYSFSPSGILWIIYLSSVSPVSHGPLINCACNFFLMPFTGTDHSHLPCSFPSTKVPVATVPSVQRSSHLPCRSPLQ